MKKDIKSPLSHMLQGLAHWMAYQNERNHHIKVIESDVVFCAVDMLRGFLPNDYSLVREVSYRELGIANNRSRIDLGIKHNGSYICLIEFKLADATNGGAKSDINKLSDVRAKLSEDIDYLVVILYRKLTDFCSPKGLVGNNGQATRKVVTIDECKVKVRRVCNSFTSKESKKSMKTICLELI